MEHVFAWGSQAKEVGQTLATVLVNGGSVADWFFLNMTTIFYLAFCSQLESGAIFFSVDHFGGDL